MNESVSKLCLRPQSGTQKNIIWGFPGGTVVKNPPANAGTQVRALVWEDPTCQGGTKPVRHNY